LQLRQRRSQIGLNIGELFQPHRNTHQAIYDTGGGAAVVTEAAVSGGGRVDNGGLGIAEVSCQ